MATKLITAQDKYYDYLKMLKENYTKIVRLEWLNSDGTVRQAITGDFIAQGTLNVNFNNGVRRTATITIDNQNNRYNFNINQLWFNQQFRLKMGLVLSNGEPYYINQGVFLIKDPNRDIKPTTRFLTLNMVDKWSNLNGDLFGKLEATYQIPRQTNIFTAMRSILRMDMGNGQPIDNMDPVFTTYYNDKRITTVDGKEEKWIETPYTLTKDGESDTYGGIMTELSDMLVSSIGYDRNGALRVEATQENIRDIDKEVLWNFKPTEQEFGGYTETIKNTEVKNVIVVCGATNNSKQAKGVAKNTNPNSPTCIQRIGERVERIIDDNYVSDKQCEDYAKWKLKCSSILQSSRTIDSTQLFHLQENRLVTITEPYGDKTTEPYLINSFTLPLNTTDKMSINVTSINKIAE